jgi:hypothetical protein
MTVADTAVTVTRQPTAQRGAGQQRGTEDYHHDQAEHGHLHRCQWHSPYPQPA